MNITTETSDTPHIDTRLVGPAKKLTLCAMFEIQEDVLMPTTGRQHQAPGTINTHHLGIWADTKHHQRQAWGWFIMAALMMPYAIFKSFYGDYGMLGALAGVVAGSIVAFVGYYKLTTFSLESESFTWSVTSVFGHTKKLNYTINGPVRFIAAPDKKEGLMGKTIGIFVVFNTTDGEEKCFQIQSVGSSLAAKEQLSELEATLSEVFTLIEPEKAKNKAELSAV